MDQKPYFCTVNLEVNQLARKKKPLPLLEGIEIVDVAAEGKAIAKVDDLVVFVPYVAPGDIVDIQLTRKKRSFAEGKATRIVSPSEDRATPFCEHFGTCGGCKWQHLPYTEQLKYKQKQVIDNLTRIGKLDIQEMLPIVASDNTTYYRNKLEFTFSNKRWLTEADIRSGEEFSQPNTLGFHVPGMFDKVLEIHKCWLQSEISNRIRNFVREYCQTHKEYTFFDLRKQEGLMRTLIIRSSSSGELMVIVAFFYEDQPLREQLLDEIAKEFPEITSLLYTINGKGNDTITDLDIIVYKGKDHMLEEMEGLKFKVGPKSFYQTNSQQAYKLYKITREFASLTGSETIYDLYTGTGTIANFVASKAKKVVGIEYVPEAIEDARINAALNNIENTVFYAGDMKDILNESFIEENGRPDVIITDPPRAGMHDDVIQVIRFAAPLRIVYVSCNPATQARDLELLKDMYEVKKACPVDMFPHTHHVENIVLLEKKEAFA